MLIAADESPWSKIGVVYLSEKDPYPIGGGGGQGGGVESCNNWVWLTSKSVSREDLLSQLKPPDWSFKNTFSLT